MKEITSLEVYKSIFNISEQNTKFDFCKDNFDEFSFTRLNVAIEEVVTNSSISPKNLKYDTMRPKT